MSTPPSDATLVGVDLGKTGCRARVVVDGGDGPLREGAGAPGLAEPNGVEAALAAVWPVVADALGAARVDGVHVLVVGAAGAEAAPERARALADALAARLPGCRVGIASDSVTAHAGALDGRPGTVLAVGTGSVALGLSANGRVARLDGWGPWLGDEGSGAWIGREALRAVLRGLDGRGPATALSEAARRRYGAPAALPLTLAQAGEVARTTAAFVPDVLAAAEAGDAVAVAVLDRALVHWSELVGAAADAVGERRVAVVGGLAAAPLLVGRWRLPAGLDLVEAAGASLDGALLLASRTDLPHEARVLRVLSREPGVAAATGPVPLPHAQDGQPTAPGAAVTATNGTVRDVDVLATEQVRTELRDLDQREPADLVDVMLAAEAAVPAALRAAAPALTDAVRRAGECLRAGGRLLYVGAGTPGRLAAVDAAECPPTFGTDPGRVVAILAGGPDAAGMAVEGAEDDAEAGARDVLAHAPGARDLVVGISASGRTPYVLSALDAARRCGSATVAIVNNGHSSARDHADVVVELLTGPEVLGGSTRLKAGTSQKIALNVLSTCAMVASGKTYGAWMVDVVASNEKLRRRARRILREAAGVDDTTAQAALARAGWRTKTALVALLAGVEAAEADRLLATAEGRARVAVALAEAAQ